MMDIAAKDVTAFFCGHFFNEFVQDGFDQFRRYLIAAGIFIVVVASVDFDMTQSFSTGDAYFSKL